MSRVHIELHRVQTWLFAVPHLRAMVGANVLLGEVLRVALSKLARETGRWQLAPCAEAYPGADPNDPLHAHDDPAADARDGIVSRDGGHFEAAFEHGAAAFADEARALLRGRLPGLRFLISIGDEAQQTGQTHLSNELPILAPCQWTGRGLASAIVEQGMERPTVSLEVKHRHEAAKRAEDRTAADLASLLGATTKLGTVKAPQDLNELVGSGYLALIHADGNGVGQAADKGDDVARARFFHRNRVLLRRALQTAVNAFCEAGTGQAPLVVLMLGGDDLLLVSRAEIALPFVVKLCDALAALQRDDPSEFELTLGVGVVIAKQKIPIHRLHEVAEQLASSAKRRFRGLKGAREPSRSVVDWAVYTAASVDDPEVVRRRDWVRGNDGQRRVLSQRPLDVIGEGLGTLKSLVVGAEILRSVPRSRSQLRYLVDQLSRGCALSKLALAELSKEARDALLRAGMPKDLWRRAANDGPSLTALFDLVEVSEIARLGRSSEHAATESEAGHG